jgi:hypothetical protein
MAFNITAELPPLPAVRILFHGLLIWAPDPLNNKHCHIGVHRGATDHYLTVEVRIKKPPAPDFIIMRHAGPLGFLSNTDKSFPGMLMQVTDEDENVIETEVKKFIAPLRFERKAASNSHPNDYRWAVDLGNIHTNPVMTDSNVITPGITVAAGIIHTALKTPDDVIIKKVKNGFPQDDFFPIAAIAGINVYLPPEQVLTLSFLKDGLIKKLPLQTAKPEEVSYEIYIDNNPTYTEEAHSEFKEYYKALPEVSASEQIDLEFHPPEIDRGPGLGTPRRELKFIDRGPGLGTPRIACMPVGNGG